MLWGQEAYGLCQPFAIQLPWPFSFILNELMLYVDTTASNNRIREFITRYEKPYAMGTFLVLDVSTHLPCLPGCLNLFGREGEDLLDRKSLLTILYIKIRFPLDLLYERAKRSSFSSRSLHSKPRGSEIARAAAFCNFSEIFESPSKQGLAD